MTADANAPSAAIPPALDTAEDGIDEPLLPTIPFGGGRRIAAGVAASVLLHLLLILFYRIGPSSPSTWQAPAPKEMTVWLRPPPAIELLPPRPPAIKPAEPKKADKPVPRPLEKKKRAPAGSITLPPADSNPPENSAAPPSSAADPFAQEAPASSDHQSEPKFDPDAARAMARKLANEADPARKDTAVAQIPAKPLRTEPEIARRIEGASRSDCRNAPGGLLAPLLILMDKKDSGCKW
jgi:hypothetical protein